MREVLLDQVERDRFLGYVDASDPDGCWPWTGQIDIQGYGKYHARRDRDGQRRWISMPAHRVSYAYLHGPFDAETLDHLCHTRDTSCEGGPKCPHRRCVRPAHLEPVTSDENIARGRSGVRQSAKTHCPQGHAYTPDNITWVVRTKGRDAGKTSRLCTICWLNRGRAASNVYHHRKRERFSKVRIETCAEGGHAWVRRSAKGRPPMRCPAHRANPEKTGSAC